MIELKVEGKFYDLAKSVNGVPIKGAKFGKGKRVIFLVAGAHGDEVEGINLVNMLVANYLTKQILSPEISVVVIPIINPDGNIANKRWNANGIDLNRNMPTADWTAEILNPRYPPGPAAASEPESKFMVELIEIYKPFFIFSMHSYKLDMINTNGDCLGVEHILHKKTGLKIEADIGYPVPGSLGTYAAIDKGIPTITYELLRDGSDQKYLEKNRDAIIESLHYLATLER